MKHSALHGVARNFADSISGGQSFVVPSYVLHPEIYAEAAVSSEGFVVLDLLKGKVIGAVPDSDLEEMAPLFAIAFPAFCAKHGVDHSDFRVCLVRFCMNQPGISYIVTVEDKKGRRTEREYSGTNGKRTRAEAPCGRSQTRQFPPPRNEL